MAIHSFVFTLNNPLANGGLEICDWLEANCSYGIIGCETGESGTFHWQGYCELTSKKRISTLCGGGRKWHVEPRRGTQEQAIAYSKKDGNYVHWGNPREQGARRDLDTVRLLAADGGMQVVSCYCNAQGIRVAEKYLSYNESERDFKPEIVWIWGPSGSGKSRLARELVDEDTYVKTDNGKWWDGYDAHSNVILDDFRDSWWSLTYMLTLIDRYSCRVEVKGGMRSMLAKKMVITCIHHPESMYRGTGECQTQLLRRIDEIIGLGTSVPDVPEVGGNTIHPDF